MDGEDLRLARGRHLAVKIADICTPQQGCNYPQSAPFEGSTKRGGRLLREQGEGLRRGVADHQVAVPVAEQRTPSTI